MQKQNKTMSPAEFKKQIAEAWTQAEVQWLVHIQISSIVGTYDEISECLALALAKLECVIEDGNEIGSRGGDAIKGLEAFQ